MTGVESMITIGTSPDDWTMYRDLAAANPAFVYYTIGIHPCSVDAQWPAAMEDVANSPKMAIRRFRIPIPARVHMAEGVPARIYSDRRGLTGGIVERYAGPWRSSGGWKSAA